MSATFCSKCGTGIAAGASFCPSCGQAVTGGPKAASGPASAKKTPIAAVAILGGGLIVLLVALTLYRTGMLSGTPGTTVPATPVATDPGAAPGTTAPGTAPGTAATTLPAQPGVAGAPATPGTPVAGTVPPRPGATAAAATAAPAAKPEPPYTKTYLTEEYAVFDITPSDAHVFVDGEDIGEADKWDDGFRSDKYEFKSPGVHYVRLVHEDYKDVWLKFIVSPTAADKKVVVEIEMEKK